MELIFKFTALMAEREFIEKVKWRTEFLDQLNNVTAADAEMAFFTYLSG